MSSRGADLFHRHVAIRAVDYAWAYRLRVARLGRGTDAARLLSGAARPVLLLPGVYETWHFLEAAARRLNAAGHPVHIVPEFGRNLRSIDEMASLAIDYLVTHDLTDVVIVAHSKGGLIGKTVMLSAHASARVTRMVAINTPFAGSEYAHLIPIRTLREFVPTHATIVGLSANAEVNARITSVYSEWDPIIPNGSELAGATNLKLPVGGHFRILDRPDLLDIVVRAASEP